MGDQCTRFVVVSWAYCEYGRVLEREALEAPTMMVHRHCLGIMLCLAVLAPALVASGQAQAPRDAKASQSHCAFDVVSIRPSAKDGYTHWHTGKDVYFVTNITAKQLVYSAFYKTDSLDGFDDIISVDQIGVLP